MKKYVTYMIGLSTMTLGIAILVSINLGPSSWDSVSLAISSYFNLSFGMATFILGVLLVLLSSLLRRSRPVLMPIVIHFLTGFLIDIWLKFNIIANLNQINDLVLAYAIAFVGMILMAIGINLYVKTELSPNAIDYFMVTVKDVTGYTFGTSKVIVDVFALTIAFLIKAPIGPFTIIIVLFLGSFVGLFDKLGRTLKLF